MAAQCAQRNPVVTAGPSPETAHKTQNGDHFRTFVAAVSSKCLSALGIFLVAGAESKDSPRLTPALNLANSSLLPGYTFARAKPLSGDQEPNHRQICLRDLIISDAPRARTPVGESRLVTRGGYDALSIAFGYDASQLISKHLSAGTVG